MSSDRPLEGKRIGITADRRSSEQADLFTKRGAQVLYGPTMRTVDLSHDESLRATTAALVDAPPDYFVATTGMGIRWWLGAAEGWDLARPLHQALQRARIVARGAKSASAIRSAGLEVWWQAPTERMDDIVEELSHHELEKAVVALQLFDPAGHPSTDALRSMAGQLVELAVYRWLLPEDPAPARRLISATVAGELDALTFTSQPAVYQLMQLAGAVGPDTVAQLRQALNTAVLTACIGPVCAEAAAEEGLTAAVWPDPPRLVGMVKLVTERLTRP